MISRAPGESASIGIGSIVGTWRPDCRWTYSSETNTLLTPLAPRPRSDSTDFASGEAGWFVGEASIGLALRGIGVLESTPSGEDRIVI